MPCSGVDMQKPLFEMGLGSKLGGDYMQNSLTRNGLDDGFGLLQG